jgi:hypothetical protein
MSDDMQYHAQTEVAFPVDEALYGLRDGRRDGLWLIRRIQKKGDLQDVLNTKKEVTGI